MKGDLIFKGLKVYGLISLERTLLFLKLLAPDGAVTLKTDPGSPSTHWQQTASRKHRGRWSKIGACSGSLCLDIQLAEPFFVGYLEFLYRLCNKSLQ